ncbi:hypothetical protein H6F67_19320 [Microcoleus sp. FACHB-1515]|uniref:NB-ARC domain-containing protein n=1 Tax=Cyanophyceae TaxID=3028117 RepID=UPI0016828B61|nr:NB-ARC domain-containing protein [Microcoleus sp. FACHB-1515]MBD2092001.1 hypothetical protein [Microcoleus sp. FACHB-1515]
MTADEALEFVESLLAQQNLRLSDLERIVFKGAWNGDSYQEIYQTCKNRTSLEHLERNVAAKLRKKLSQVLGEPVKKNTLQGLIDRAWKAMHPNDLNSITSANPSENRSELEIDREDWYRFVPDVPLFVGRNSDLNQLARQIRLRGCRLLTLYGIGGVGKTALAAKLGETVWDQFQVCIWRSIVHQRPTMDALIADLQEVLSDRPAKRLRDQLRDRRCLIVLDGFEALLQGGVHDGAYLDGYEEYGQLFSEIGHTMHQSCFILTSREEPKEIAALKEQMPAAVQSFPVRGLGDRSVRTVFNHKGSFSGSDGDWWTLMRLYDGNPYALNEVAAFIRDFYGGDIAQYLEESQEEVLLDHARSQIETQFARLSPLERQVVNYLAEHEPATFSEIQTANRSRQLRAALNSLRRRSLLEIDEANYGLTRLLRRYLLDGSEVS